MRTWRTFAGVCWTGKRFDFDGGAQEVLGRGRNPPVTALPCQPPLGKGAKGTGVRIATASDIGHWFAMTRFLQGVRYKAGSGGQRRPPLRRGTRSAMGGRPQGSPLRKRCKERGGAGDCEGRPCGSVTWSAWRRGDVGSELSAASGRGSEVSEWPRSKFPASAVRQRRNFGHRNRVIVPYGARRVYYFDF